MSLSDEDKLDLAISALQSIAAYPDARNIEELQWIVRQRLAALPVPRFVPEPVEIIHDPFSPKYPPPEPLRDAPQPADNTAFLPCRCPICTIYMCCVPCVPLMAMLGAGASDSYVLLTGFTRDEYGRIICIQYAELDGGISFDGELLWM